MPLGPWPKQKPHGWDLGPVTWQRTLCSPLSSLLSSLVSLLSPLFSLLSSLLSLLSQLFSFLTSSSLVSILYKQIYNKLSIVMPAALYSLYSLYSLYYDSFQRLCSSTERRVLVEGPDVGGFINAEGFDIAAMVGDQFPISPALPAAQPQRLRCRPWWFALRLPVAPVCSRCQNILRSLALGASIRHPGAKLFPRQCPQGPSRLGGPPGWGPHWHPQGLDWFCKDGQ